MWTYAAVDKGRARDKEEEEKEEVQEERTLNGQHVTSALLVSRCLF
jgi:hypothetical protein